MTIELAHALRSLPRPEPAMGLAAYEEARRRRFDAYPACKENFERFLKSQRQPTVDYLPIKLDIENVSRCNFRCTMCQVSDWEKGARARDLSVEDFKKLIDEQIGLVEIKLQGMGEPTLAADQLFQMIAYARAREIWVRTITNASLLHLKDNFRRLIDSDPNEIQISIDGATADVFEAIRRGSVFERVCENCKLINKYCDDQSVARTKMWTVVQSGNVHQLPLLVDLAAELGFRNMAFSLNLTNWGSPAWAEHTEQVTVERSLSPDIAYGLIEQGERLGVKVAFWNVTAKYSTETLNSMCPWPFERAFISSDMRIAPCCMIANPDTFELGDAYRFTEIWHGAAMQDFRNDHLSGNLPAICQGCYKSNSAL